MPQGIDLLHLFPELAAIGQQQLQVYCNEWVRRPIAHEYGIVQIIVDRELLLRIGLDPSALTMIGNRALFPTDELLGYIIDHHFHDAEKRRTLHASVREVRHHWSELNRDYEARPGRMGTLYLQCKNPACQAIMQSTQEAHEGQTIRFGPAKIECLTCGETHRYDGGDFRLKVTD